MADAFPGRVGFIGVGDMGGPLAQRILTAGIPLTIFDVRTERVALFRDAGAKIAASPAELASQVEIAFACLPKPEISEQVAYGDTGVIHGSKLKVYVEMSTVGAITIQRIHERLRNKKIGMLDAPVSGGPIGAATGSMTCIVSGLRSELDYAAAPLAAMFDRLFHIGDQPGQSQILKLANNLLTAANLTIASEVVHMARLAGIDPELAIEVINSSSGRNRATEVTFPQQILNGNYSLGAKLSILHKDVELALGEAERLGALHTVSESVVSLWRAAFEAGQGELDMSRIYQLVGESGYDG